MDAVRSRLPCVRPSASTRAGDADIVRPCLKGWSGVTALIVSMCCCNPAVRKEGDRRIRRRPAGVPLPPPEAPAPAPAPDSAAVDSAKPVSTCRPRPPTPPLIMLLLPVSKLSKLSLFGYRSNCGGPRRSAGSSMLTSGFVAGLSSDRGRSSRVSNDSPSTSVRLRLDVVARALLGRGVRTLPLPRGSVWAPLT